LSIVVLKSAGSIAGAYGAGPVRTAGFRTAATGVGVGASVGVALGVSEAIDAALVGAPGDAVVTDGDGPPQAATTTMSMSETTMERCIGFSSGGCGCHRASPFLLAPSSPGPVDLGHASRWYSAMDIILPGEAWGSRPR
jgi:hypothetical protein